MNTTVIGREEEIDIMQRVLDSNGPELLAMYGRRRVGKTFLIRNFFAQQLIFSCSGQLNGTTKEQLQNFSDQLHTWFPAEKNTDTPTSWRNAFVQLRNCIDRPGGNKKKVVFFDELPWLDGHKSGFLSAFDYFWNNYASTRSDLLVVICGSAASWIISKVLNNKGGLHNRITQRIRLLPFSLKESEAYLQHRNIRFDRYQLLQLYMTMGGVPHYLNAVQRGKSVQQNIEQICFSKDGALVNEFDNLYAALFNNYEKHIQVVKALAKKNRGLTRSDLLTTGKLISGGAVTAVLGELIESGFVEKIQPFGKKEKDSLYRLADEFTLFYFRFMQGQKGNEKGQWLTKSLTPAYVSWCGYAFENICFKHIVSIKRALEIGGVQSSQSSWYKAGSKESDGTQIDLLIDRADHCINVCEMKFAMTPFAIDKKYAEVLRNKLMVFRQQTATRKHLLLTLITTYGMTTNENMLQLVDNTISAEALFS